MQHRVSAIVHYTDSKFILHKIDTYLLLFFYREAFRCLDHNQDGSVDCGELESLLKSHADDMTPSEIGEMTK